MNFDLRIPIGLMFSVFGLILIFVGLFGSPELVQKSLGLNMNLWWGAFQFLFGTVMLLLPFRGRKGERNASQSAAKACSPCDEMK